MSDYLSKRRKSSPARVVTMTALASFLLGSIGVGWLAYRWGAANGAPEQAIEQPVADLPENGAPLEPSPTPTESEAAASAAVERVEETQGGIEQRLAAAEQRVANLDLQAQAAAGNAARAEGLLIAFATRRALERGAELGYLADQLRLRFGDALPNAVDTIVTFSRDPVTLDQLLARLEGLEPQITREDSAPSFERFRRELADLFVVRRQDAPSPQPTRRVERARLFLESGRVNAAIAEVSNLPGADQAQNWVRDARRYGASMRALDLVETAAVLEPRRLRDGAGNRIEQGSPAEDTGATPAN